ncbi:MAG TPA: class I SAM-dependent methyltransferase [Solirubrobacteraceae bacterium]
MTADRQPDSAERYEREKAFHDERFAHDDRSANRFYAIDAASVREFERRIAALPADADVLDYGCGSGAYAAIALARAPGRRVVAVDLSPVALEQAAAAAEAAGVGGRIEFREMNAEALEFEDATFDAVCGNGVLHHLDLERAYAEVARVMKPGGSGLFLEPMGHNPLINAYRRRTPEQRTPDEHPLLTADFDLARRWFAEVEPTYFSLLSLGTLPFAPARDSRRLIDRLDAVDRALFRRLPAAGRFAWLVLVALRGPRAA